VSEVLDQEPAAKGGFFAVDSRIWPKVCELGMNEPVAYLVQARGTGRDNRTTTWSVDSIERYTGISRHRAAAAVKRIRDVGLTRLLRGGTKPKYELVPFSELPGADPRPALSCPEEMAVDRVQRGLALSRNHRDQARRAVNKGWLVEHQGEFAIAPPEIKPDLIWLPNKLIDGAAGETPPLELVRQTQDAMIVRLLIEMYHAQHLREDGGIFRQIILKKFERIEVGKQAQFTVWGFRPDEFDCRMWWRGFTEAHRCPPTAEQKDKGKDSDANPYFRRQEHLINLGLLEWVPHLVESAEESGEIIHPLGIGRSESIEDRLGRAAHEAGRALVTEGQYEWAIENGIHQLVPVPRHISNVQMIGIARLRYRPHTRMTAAWWADLNANAEKHLARYAEIAACAIARIPG
jgi:hypothetical protein